MIVYTPGKCIRDTSISRKAVPSSDPHPGNMMRTEDGKLAILDFGLMTQVTNDQKYGMIEAIAHLISTYKETRRNVSWQLTSSLCSFT